MIFPLMLEVSRVEHTIVVRLLGPVEVEYDGVGVRGFASRKTLALLCYLILARRPVSRAHLAALLWSDKAPAQGRANLSWSLHALSAAVPGVLKVDRDLVAWVTGGEQLLDIVTFRACAARNVAAAWAQAMALYRGDLLEGLYLDGCPEWELWLNEERERWRQQAIDLLHALAAHYLSTRAYPQGLETTGRLLQIDPLDEEAHCMRMRLLHRAGQRAPPWFTMRSAGVSLWMSWVPM